MGNIAKASLEELRKMKEEGQISPPRPDAVPVELPADFWDNAEVKFPVSKQPVNLRIDVDILEFFKEGGRGYQSRIHSVLRSYVDAQRRP
ncbi:MAG: BrnA antitoxin family protein [Boseongicola sp.]|nr:BrnA antitoxin family protein [Boseongicola sp.]